MEIHQNAGYVLVDAEKVLSEETQTSCLTCPTNVEARRQSHWLCRL